MIELKQYDTGRTITDTLTLDGVPVDGTGATVKFVMRPHSSKTPVASFDASFSDPQTDGKVSLSPPDEMVASSGLFEVEWEVTLSNEKVLFFPTVGYDLMQIYPNAAPIQ